MTPNHRAWFRKADEDLLIIENNLQAARVPWPLMSFHAQQLAEKYLKGFLVFHLALPPKTHDLSRLLVLGRDHDPTLAAFAAECEELTALGFRSRYPDWPQDEQRDEADARRAIEMAQRIRAAIRERVPDEPSS